MALRGKLVELLALESPLLGDHLGRDPLRHDVEALLELWRERPVAGSHGVGAHRHARHVLDPAGDHDVVLAGHHAHRGEVGGLLARAAHPVESRAAHLDGKTGDQRGVSRDVEPLLADLIDAAEDDVLDLGRIDLQAGDQILQYQRREIIRANARELSAFAPNGRPHGPDDDCIPHDDLPGATEQQFILPGPGGVAQTTRTSARPPAAGCRRGLSVDAPRMALQRRVQTATAAEHTERRRTGDGRSRRPNWRRRWSAFARGRWSLWRPSGCLGDDLRASHRRRGLRGSRG